MKIIYLLPIFLLVNFTGFSQDTLFTKNGKTLPVKVVEIGLNEIHYRNISDPDKLCTMSMSDVNSIHYANGTKDEFYYVNSPLTYNVAPNDSISNAVAHKNNSNTDTQNNQGAVYNRSARNEATAEAVYIGLRVIGFALRVALEIATSNSCHHSSYNNSHYSSNHPRGH